MVCGGVKGFIWLRRRSPVVLLQLWSYVWFLCKISVLHNDVDEDLSLFMMPCALVNRYPCFGGAYCLHLRGPWTYWVLKVGGNRSKNR